MVYTTTGHTAAVWISGLGAGAAGPATCGVGPRVLEVLVSVRESRTKALSANVREFSRTESTDF